jgi:RNA polymerase subunit RPABC4/transcription elongation factor Spt4
VSGPTHLACKCGELFPADEAQIAHSRESAEFWGAIVAHETELAHCPTCDSDELDDVWLCERCLIRRADEEGTDLCRVCAVEGIAA